MGERMSDEFYLQDKRAMVGNAMVWWRRDSKGYCCDVRDAHRFTREEAFKQHESRETDVPWPCDYIDARVSHTVDCQLVDLAQAQSVPSTTKEPEPRG